MGYSAVQRVVGFLIAVSSLMMLPPVLVSWWFQDGTANLFLVSSAILLFTGIIIYLPVRDARQELRLRDGFLVVVSSWLALVLVGALPFVLLTSPNISYVDAVFESMSGLTTTGATIMTQIDLLPESVLYYRQQLQWLGGMGIIVLAVAILPMLRIGGMQLYRAETPGPMKDSKLTPRITETAKALWMIYFGLTLACMLAYWFGGMSLFDAIGHSFSTVAIGGFSTHTASFAYWNSPVLETIAGLFMIFSGVNFALHFTAWKHSSAQPYFTDPEFKVYLYLIAVFSVIASVDLYYRDIYTNAASAIRFGTFQVISAITTTGFTSDSFHLWPSFLPIVLICIAFIGGCAGSTAGGMKVIRMILLFKQSTREIKRLVHPHAVFPIKIGRQKISDHVMDAIWGFFFLYIASFALMTVLLTATGVDEVTAYSTVAACITNLGPALGEAGVHYYSLNDKAKMILTFAMLLGRLEIYTVLVLFVPVFWRD